MKGSQSVIHTPQSCSVFFLLHPKLLHPFTSFYIQNKFEYKVQGWNDLTVIYVKFNGFHQINQVSINFSRLEKCMLHQQKWYLNSNSFLYPLTQSTLYNKYCYYYSPSSCYYTIMIKWPLFWIESLFSMTKISWFYNAQL